MKISEYLFGSVPGAILLGSILVSTSILFSGGVIKIKSPGLVKQDKSTLSPPQSDSTTGDSLEKKLVTLAGEIGLDKNAFKSCIDSRKFDAEVSKDISDAGAAGINGTPGFIIGKAAPDGIVTGVKVPGAYPFSVFEKVITQLLAGVPASQVLAAAEGLQEGKVSVDDDPVLGDKDAPLTIVEFSDYECPYCNRHYTQTLPSLKKDYINTGKLRLVYRDFIAVPSHNPAATTEALAANCARDQGGDEAYYKLHDEIFAKTQANGLGI